MLTLSRLLKLFKRLNLSSLPSANPGNGNPWLHSSGSVVVGSFTASLPLTGGTVTGVVNFGTLNRTNSVDPVVNVCRAVNTGSGNGHCFSDSSDFSRAGGVAYNSFDGRITVSGSHDYDHYAAFQSAPTFNSVGTTSDLYGLVNLPTINSGTITNSYAVDCWDPDGAGVVVNNYGLHVQPLTKGVNNWAVYTEGATPSRFTGRVGFGRNPDVGVSIDVDGNSNVGRCPNSSTSAYAAINDDATGWIALQKRGSTETGLLATTGGPGELLTFACPLVIETYNAHAIRFGTNNTYRAQLNSAGRWLIGTSTDDGSNLVQVNGGLQASRISTPNFALGYTSTATSNGTLVLTSSSNNQQFFTGTSNHTVVLPVASTMVVGQRFIIENNSTGTVTVNSSGGNQVVQIVSGASVKVTCVLASGTTASSWDFEYVGFATVTGTGANVLATSPTFTTPNIGAATGTSLVLSGSVQSLTVIPTAALVNADGSIGANGPAVYGGFSGYGIGFNSNGESVVLINNTARARIGTNIVIGSTGIFGATSGNAGVNNAATVTLSRLDSSTWQIGTGGTPNANASLSLTNLVASGYTRFGGITKTSLLALTPNASTQGIWRVTDSTPKPNRLARPTGTEWVWCDDETTVT